MKSLVLGYLALTHVLLYASSPYYRHEVSRALIAGRKACRRAAAAYQGAYHGRGSNQTAADTAAALPKSGVYASTDLLHVIQAHMSLEGGKADNSTSTSATAGYSSGPDSLIAYMSASDILLGEGWKARSALFVFMMAPRYILTTRSRFARELDLFHLARGDLPAVGLFNRSEVGVLYWWVCFTDVDMENHIGVCFSRSFLFNQLGTLGDCWSLQEGRVGMLAAGGVVHGSGGPACSWPVQQKRGWYALLMFICRIIHAFSFGTVVCCVRASNYACSRGGGVRMAGGDLHAVGMLNESAVHLGLALGLLACV